jgi:glycosyltransferase involved in cell wall biosynthesis
LSEVEGIHFVSPSTWLARKAMQSSLLVGKNISVIHNPVPDVFFDSSSIPRATSGNLTILGFIAEDLGNPNKGFKLFLDALSLLDDKARSHFRFQIACQRGHELIPSFLNSETSSPVGDEELIRFYRSIDFLVVPSVQDNSPNVIIEALSAGAKVVGSDTGGISELLQPFASVLFRKDSPEDLARVLKNISQEGIGNSQISDAASYFGYQVHSEKMISLYQNN